MEPPDSAMGIYRIVDGLSEAQVVEVRACDVERASSSFLALLESLCCLELPVMWCKKVYSVY